MGKSNLKEGCKTQRDRKDRSDHSRTTVHSGGKREGVKNVKVFRAPTYAKWHRWVMHIEEKKDSSIKDVGGRAGDPNHHPGSETESAGAKQPKKGKQKGEKEGRRNALAREHHNKLMN